ncbi:uncharacterized small protein (DUF1192 family) [Variovorax sp. 1140]|jgi:uncharacterized small protein (DUF1192 family)|uniref:hypothetical protein n=1 Tax=Variovorax TaxID=34072 RepID=UPI00264A108A|nr:hypothetical protein [Variovorax sp. CAN15]MDN6884585.1 hypothetical protein [Variovorax sp. CAN15]
MNDERGTIDKPAQGFWQKLKLALEGMDESYVAGLESRIRLLELEVARLSELERKRHGVCEPGVA